MFQNKGCYKKNTLNKIKNVIYNNNIQSKYQNYQLKIIKTRM